MKLLTFFVLTLALVSGKAIAREYHVSPKGNDTNPGTVASPLRTVSAAAELAYPGDVITVHEGIYREWVNPPRGGTSDEQRITYRAAPGEKAEIRGSEIVKDWKKDRDGLWTVKVPNSLFGDYNPFAEEVKGKWYKPEGRTNHTGCVYIDGEWLYEAAKKQDLIDQPDEHLKLAWFAEVTNDVTTIWAVFDGKDPNDALTEINVRETVFYPQLPFRNYITVHGFTMRHAAPNYANPIVEQKALLGAHWSKGWIIENNTISHSINAGISIGRYGNKEDYERYSTHCAAAAQYVGYDFSSSWNRETVGGHIVRNNEVSYCEQVGIVGCKGSAFSRIIGNHVHHIHVQRRFTGAEMAGIKVHYATDTYLAGNRIHDTNLAFWLDWSIQGARVSRNLCYRNDEDIFLEADHGPIVLDNNLFLSNFVRDRSEGMAFVHNLLVGEFDAWLEAKRTPSYFRAHSTELAGTNYVVVADTSCYNNIFVGDGTAGPTKASIKELETYEQQKGQRIIGYGMWMYDQMPTPLRAAGNIYCHGAKPSTNEMDCVVTEINPAVKLTETGDDVFLSLTIPEQENMKTPLVTTSLLGKSQVADLPFEDYDGRPLVVDVDYFGHPRNPEHPTPGPFEDLAAGEHRLQVWPVGFDR